MKGNIVAFCCEHSAYAAADLAAKQGLCYGENLRIIPVPCAGRMDTIHILKAFEKGAVGVLVLGCEEGACHHITGNIRAEERVESCAMLLKGVGMDSRRVGIFNLSPNAAHKFVRVVNEMNQRIKELGEPV